jgi:hypothetical protein
MKTFIAYSFDESDRPIVAVIERLLASHDVPVTTGSNVGGGDITEQVKGRIDSVESLIAVMTRDEQVATRAGAPEKWRTHPWVSR